jgi:hypothetical protein
VTLQHFCGVRSFSAEIVDRGCIPFISRTPVRRTSDRINAALCHVLELLDPAPTRLAKIAGTSTGRMDQRQENHNIN